MSGPFRFNQETASPLEQRSASPFSSGQPVSFKTNVNRMKTQKWVQAKKNAYDGDDWGDYDEYDEYGIDQEPSPQPESASRHYAQRLDTPSRSFTDPTRQGPSQPARRNSFEAGEEHRAFSASVVQPQQDYNQQQQQQQPQQQQHYGQYYGHPLQQQRDVEANTSGSPEQRHDFSASAMPTPLQTRISSIPADVYSASPNSQFPPRKSSIGHMTSPITNSSRSPTGSSEQPISFIRPADIYKRHEEERQRASLDATRPNSDTLSSRPADGLEAPQAGSGKLPPPLETVAERKSEYMPNYGSALQQDGQPAQTNASQSPQQTRMSQLRPISTSDNDPWSGASQSQTPASDPVVSPRGDQGFRSFVDQAFTRRDEQRSVPPTPISNSDSDMHRSNTGSTSGISPIMSRVPSSAAAAAKLRNEGSTPAIAEERETPVSRPTSAYLPDVQHQGPRSLPPGHSRNISASSIPHSGLITPTSGDSPARSPVIASRIALPAPETAQIGTESPDSPDTTEGGLKGPSSSYVTREADIANAIMSSPVKSVPELSATELQSQDAFLKSHSSQSPIRDVLPRDRSESPSKGRVQALAGRFGDVSSSRRGSTQSDNSRHSLQSWERSHDHSRATSPTKANPSKLASPTKEFRPHLPGQWESYATTAITPSDQSEKDRGLGFEQSNVPSALEEVDLTPTTAKRPVSVVEPSQPAGTMAALTEDPISALKEAGAAMVQSFRTTVGLDDTSSEPQQEQRRYSQDRSHGNLYMPRPLQLDRPISAMSSAPPTPLAKDTPESESAPFWGEETPPLSAQEQRPPMLPQLSTAPSADDQESDRLRKEIVASLSPLRTSMIPAEEPKRNLLQSTSPSANRASSILPIEYESYWADENRGSPRPLQDVQRNLSAASPTIPASAPAPVPASTSARFEDPTTPLLAHRFSWEASAPNLATPDSQAQTSIIPEPTKGLQQPAVVPPTVEHAAEEERKQWSEGLSDSYFGPRHTLTVTKPDPITDGHLATRSTTPPPDSTKALHSSRQEPKRLSGLHVVNSELDPEAVDLPPRLSAEMSYPMQPDQDEPKTSQQQTEDGLPNPAIASMKGLTESPIVQDSTPKSPTSPITDKPLGTREIATINSPQERIATYNKMRDHWATVDHGLGSWVAAVVEADPDLATQPGSLQRVTTGTARHRHTGSLPLLGKFTTSMGGQPQGAAQPDSATAPVFVAGSSPTATMQSSSTSGPSGRVARDQMQAKGEKLLHTAGVLSGKGLTSAKGLFAKGKSRFGRDKDSLPSSRKASEESEFAATRPTTASTREKSIPPLAGADSPKEEKRRRRFSMSLPRTGRSKSRSRPGSISFSSNTPSIFGSSSQERVGRTGRPHSFHAPESWNTTSRSQTPPPQSPSRLGVLPSPGRSPVSFAPEHDGNVPPVPRIPDEFDNGDKKNSSRTLQSIIRHSTPPIAGEDIMISPVQSLRKKTSQRGNDKFEKPLPSLPGQTGMYEDVPPRLKHDPLSVVTGFQSGEVSPVESSFTPSNANDSEDEDRVLQPNTTSMLQAPTVTQTLADVSPLLPPVGLPLDDVSNDDGLETATGNEHGERSGPQTGAVSKNKTSSVPDHITAMALQHITSKLTSTSGSAGRDLPPSSSPQQQGHASESSDTEAIHYDKIGTSITPKRMSFETGSSGAEDASFTSIHLQNKNTTPRTERSSPIPVWFTNSDLRLPKVRADAVERNVSRAGTLTPPNQDGAGSGSHSPIPKQADKVQEEAAGNVSLSEIWTTPLNPPRPRHRAASNVSAVSVTQLQVVHAVEEYAASNSSLASWDNDSIANSETSQPDELRDERDFSTPVAQGPRNIQYNQAEEDNDDTPIATMSNGYFLEHEIPAESRHRAQQYPALTSETSVPERSKSLLSVISSMVSDATPNSASSSTAGRSTPSTIHRIQNDSTMPTRAHPQIPEELHSTNNEHTPSRTDDDYDLYADHNGLVKDLRDEHGQPFCVSAPDQGSVPPQNTQSSGPEASAARDALAMGDADMSRYNTERPMSFVSGSQDEEGKPQDQINRFVPSIDASVLPDVEQNGTQRHVSSPAHMDAVYRTAPPSLDDQQRNHMTEQQQPQSKRRLSPGSVPQNRESWDMNTMAYKTLAPRMLIPASHPPLQPAEAPMHPERLPINDQMPQNGQARNWAAQDPRMFQMSSGQPAPQGLPMQGSSLPQHVPRVHGQPPQTEAEYKQRMLQLQTNQAQSRGLENQAVRTGQQLARGQIPQQQENRHVSPAFQSFGGKSQPNPQPPADAPNPARNLNGNLAAADPNRSGSRHSAVSSLSHEPASLRPEGQLNAPISHNRSPGNGENSNYSHISRGSTWAQPAESRTDSKKPVDTGPSQKIPPQLPRVEAPTPPGQSKQQQSTTSGASETGKKKRFSALGALFGRNEKKAAKPQRHSTPPPSQLVSVQPSPVQPQPSRQWPPPQQKYVSPPPSMQYVPNQVPANSVPGMHPMGPHFTSNQTMSLQQHYPHPRPGPPYQQQPPSVRPDENSAFLNTKRLAEEHAAKLAHAQRSQQASQASRPGLPAAPFSFEQPLQGNHGPPGTYYRPDTTISPPLEQGTYAASQFARQQALQQKQQVPAEPGAYGASQAARQQVQKQQQPSVEPSAYGAAQAERAQAPQQQQHQQQLPAGPHSVGAHHPPPNNRNTSGSVPVHDPYMGQPVSPRHMSMDEPRYETPSIPAAYNPVSGAFISPRDQAQLPLFHPQHTPQGRSSLDQYGQQHSDPQMQQLSPQVSAQSQMPPYDRPNSDASAVSVISPISNSPPNVPFPNQRSQYPRMSSISEVRNQEQPWNFDVPAGATEQEIVRARQRQYIEEQFTTQQHLHAERVARSTSPRVSSQKHSPSPHHTPSGQSQGQGGGFRELLPRSSPQPYPISSSPHSPNPEYDLPPSRSPHLVQPMPIHPGHTTHPAAYPLPMSPQLAGVSSPVNPIAQSLPPPPPPKIPYSPMRSSFHEPKSPLPSEEHPAYRSRQYQSSPSTEHQWPLQQQQYEDSTPNEPPPSYQGIGIADGGMDKDRPERSQPPNTTTNTAGPSHSRQRQSSLGILQHPQPASMAASPISSTPDMGSESLRRQLLEQEERARLERTRTAQLARIESGRERQEREIARARARELERSISGGGKVGSLRSVTGSTSGASGWERRGSITRPIFELPAVEDDEPVMRATSFPGQEWVPPMWTDD